MTDLKDEISEAYHEAKKNVARLEQEALTEWSGKTELLSYARGVEEGLLKSLIIANKHRTHG